MSAARRVLVIGAGGFVGPWITREFSRAGWEVIGVRRGPVATTASDGVSRWKIADATVIDSYADELDGIDGVVYNAAHIPKNFADSNEAEACLRVNALTPLYLLQRLATTQTPFLYISTGQGYLSSKAVVDERDPSWPVGHATFYLSSKLLGDFYAEHFRNSAHLPTVTLRVGSLYGPGQRRGMISQFITAALAGETITLMDGGRHRADLTFVGDVGKAAVSVFERQAAGIFNIGSGVATNALEAAEIILRAAGKSAAQLLNVKPATAASPAGFYALDMSRARTELALIPTPPEIGLSRSLREWT